MVVGKKKKRKEKTVVFTNMSGVDCFRVNRFEQVLLHKQTEWQINTHTPENITLP